ncbi:hypothetical protein AVEN_168399-1 [Araneus ventricosus]|uniref:Uncharacterized protein n=1 Tax=Araneus ventricosus TaxID=182803 RepID=A0A4Y2GR19_ARAVE|nr:hypothetical protein AVEN_168399-1 [Araneus ventricosus]
MEDTMFSFDNSHGILDIQDYRKLGRCGLIHANLTRVWDELEFLITIVDSALYKVCGLGNSNYIDVQSISDQKETIDDLLEHARSYHRVSSEVIQFIRDVSNADITLQGEFAPNFSRIIRQFYGYQLHVRDLMIDITDKCSNLYDFLYQINQSLL